MKSFTTKKKLKSYKFQILSNIFQWLMIYSTSSTALITMALPFPRPRILKYLNVGDYDCIKKIYLYFSSCLDLFHIYTIETLNLEFMIWKKKLVD